jgi:cysteine desulfurase
MAVTLPIYFDNHATTPVDPRVLETMMPYFTTAFGNAASRNHVFGWRAESAVEQAREHIAALIGGQAKEIVFTSGATESNNLAIKGVLEFYESKGNHIITAATEHKAVIDTCKYLERRGARVTFLPVRPDGLIDLDELRSAITDKTVLVSIMFANNEIGVLQPVSEIGKICKERGVLFHCDAVQAAGKVPLDVEAMGMDLVSISAHKMYGPKGVGALWVRRGKPRVRLAPNLHGGGHERGMRSGTLNVPGIAGFGRAAEIARAEMAEESARVLALREHLRDRIAAEIPECFVNGSLEHRLAGNLNFSVAYVEGESLLMALKDIALSSGSACTSASLEPSYVLRALGVGDELAHSSLRVGLGRFNTRDEVDFFCDLLRNQVERLRALSPLWEMVQEGVDLKSIQWAATAH